MQFHSNSLRLSALHGPFPREISNVALFHRIQALLINRESCSKSLHRPAPLMLRQSFPSLKILQRPKKKPRWRIRAAPFSKMTASAFQQPGKNRLVPMRGSCHKASTSSALADSNACTNRKHDALLRFTPLLMPSGAECQRLWWVGTRNSLVDDCSRRCGLLARLK